MLFANNPMLTADDRQQAGYAGLMALAQGLMAGGSPSLQPGGMAKGLAEGFGGFAKNYQGSLTNAAAMKSAALQQQMAQAQVDEAKRKQAAQLKLSTALSSMKPPTQMANAGDNASGQQISSTYAQALQDPDVQSAMLELYGPSGVSALGKMMGIGEGHPASVREWQYYNGLSKEDKERYLTMKRANPWVNMGGSMMSPSQVEPGGPPQANVPKTVSPDAQPDLKGRQAESAALGTGRGEAQVAAEKKATDATRTIDILKDIDSLIDRSTGSALGAIRDAGGSIVGHSTEGAQAIAELRVVQAALMTSMPRMEGPQSDRDVQLYQQAAGQIGDPTVPAATRKAAVKMIRALQEKYKTPSGGAASAAAPQDPLGIR
jgi:hypothetical protein